MKERAEAIDYYTFRLRPRDRRHGRCPRRSRRARLHRRHRREQPRDPRARPRPLWLSSASPSTRKPTPQTPPASTRARSRSSSCPPTRNASSRAPRPPRSPDPPSSFQKFRRGSAAGAGAEPPSRCHTSVTLRLVHRTDHPGDHHDQGTQRNALIHEGARVTNSTLGRYTEVGPGSILLNSTLDDYSYTTRFCDLANTSVGKFANIAAFSRIGPTDHPLDRASLHHFMYRSADYWPDAEHDAEFFAHRESRRTVIGHDTWIGHGAIIRPEVTVGHGAVVAAGAVVTKDVAPYTIVAGCPATPLRERQPPAIADRLIALAWWDWDHARCAPRWRISAHCRPRPSWRNTKPAQGLEQRGKSANWRACVSSFSSSSPSAFSPPSRSPSTCGNTRCRPSAGTWTPPPSPRAMAAGITTSPGGRTPPASPAHRWRSRCASTRPPRKTARC
jgi:phosphonate metabolism protein (transferase hexapeptide repeat family)